MFIWDFVADKILGQIVDWFYGQVVGFLGNFFSEMGSMGAELFEMNWVQSVVLFFSYLGWALFATGLVVAVFECGIEYSAGRGNVKETALNVLKGFLAVSLFTQVPVRLYSLAISLQGTLTAGITGFGSTSIGDAAKAALADLENLESLTESTYPLRGFGRETSGLMEEVYAQLSVWLGRAVTAEERSNAVKIYSMVMGSAGSGTYNGAYEPGGNAPMELEASMFTDPATKNSADLAIYAASAWNSGWGYVWGTFGQVLTPELLQYKISQYPEGVGDEADLIRSHWLNRRTTDCVGLIKGYGWLNTVTMEIQYGSNGMPDVGADGMYYNASRKGSIETMPDTPGLAVWKSGHIGVYIGNGEVIEAMDTRYGVVKTKLQGRGWSHWLEVPGIKYD